MTFLLGIFCLWAAEPNTFMVTVDPFDIQNDRVSASLFSGLRQLEIDGDVLIVRPTDSTRLLLFDRDGNFLSQVGRQGGGPGEFAHAMQAFSVRGQSIWTLTSQGDRAYYFEGGELVLEFDVPNYNLNFFSQCSDAFAFDQDVILVPAHPKTKSLAQAFDYGGNFLHEVGEILPYDRDLLKKNPAINDTMWAKNEAGWFCLFKYQAILIHFDKNFREVNRFDLTGPEIEEKNDALTEHKPTRSFRFPFAHFSDFKIFNGDGFAISGKALYQIDLETGDVKSRTKFMAKAEQISDSLKGVPLRFFYFDFFEDGTVVLGHPAIPWDHDLWKARLPFLIEGS